MQCVHPSHALSGDYLAFSTPRGCMELNVFGAAIQNRHQEAINTTQRNFVTELANKHDGGSAAIKAVFV